MLALDQILLICVVQSMTIDVLDTGYLHDGRVVDDYLPTYLSVPCYRDTNLLMFFAPER